MSASPQYYECIDETFEEVESKLEELESDPDIATAEGVLNVTFILAGSLFGYLILLFYYKFVESQVSIQ